MDITRTSIRLAHSNSTGLKAYCSLTFDGCLVVNDIKVIQLETRLMVAMPGRKVTQGCNDCRFENPVQAKYCSECGSPMPEVPPPPPGERAVRFMDVVHPINRDLRLQIEAAVISEYEREARRIRENLPEYPGAQSYNYRPATP